MGEFRVTKEWLNKHSSKGAGWTAQQMRALGLPWPPAKGWMRRASGMVITDAQRAAFERLHAERRTHGHG